MTSNYDGYRLILMNARTANGTDGYVLNNALSNPTAIIQVSGTMDGASITFSMESPDGTDVAINDSAGTAKTITAAGTYEASVVRGERIKATLASAGASTSVTVALYL